MSHGVNLLPEHCLRRTRRSSRRSTWLAVNVCALALAIVAGVAAQASQRRLALLTQRLERAAESEMDSRRQLTMELQRRDQLLTTAREIAARHNGAALAPQLAALAGATTPGIALQELRVAPVAGTRKTQPPSAAANSNKTPAAPNKPRSEPVIDASDATHVAIAGYARSHSELSAYLAALRAIPGWERMELQQAVADAQDAPGRLAFRLECSPQGDR